MITGEMLKQILEGASKYEDVVIHQAADLIDQTLKFFIFDSILSIIQTSSVFILVYVARRVIGHIIEEIQERLDKYKQKQEELEKKIEEDFKNFRYSYHDNIANEENTILWAKGWRTAVTLLGTAFFLFHSVPHFRTIGKIMVAPKLFIIEKSAEFIKSPDVKKENVK